MTARFKVLFCGFALAATAALAHQGVKNPVVMARMDAMRSIGDNTKILGTMVKGERAFDAATARQAATEIAQQAARVAALFEAREDDPKSEALPVIWEDYTDFTEKAELLESAATDAAGMISSSGDLEAAFGKIGATCKACHKTYRE